MLLKIQIVTGMLSIMLLLITFDLMRRRKLREQYALLWIFAGLAILTFSLWHEEFLTLFIDQVTVLFYLSVLFWVALIFLLFIVFRYSMVISTLANQNKELAQRHALLELEFRELRNHYGMLQHPSNQNS